MPTYQPIMVELPPMPPAPNPPPSSNAPFIALVGVMAVGIAGAVAIIIWGPVDATPLVVSILGTMATVMTALLAFSKSSDAARTSESNGETLRQLHIVVNGRLSQLLDVSSRAAAAEATVAAQSVAVEVASQAAQASTAAAQAATQSMVAVIQPILQQGATGPLAPPTAPVSPPAPAGHEGAQRA